MIQKYMLIVFFIFFAKEIKTPANLWQRSRKVIFLIKCYLIGSKQKSLRLHDSQCFPIQTSSNWFMACSTIS